MTAALVISMSDFAKFKRCRKSFELTWARELEPLADREVMAKGRTFHAFLEAYARAKLAPTDKYQAGELARLRTELIESGAADDPMKAVAEQYIARRWKVDPERIVSIEQPYYTLLLEPPDPPVWLRTTFDLVLRDDDDWVVGRDYKSFAAASTLDVDLDFQGKIYVAVLQRQFKTDRARFEYENVRQTPPGVVKDKQGGVWREDECYNTVPLYPSKHEVEGVWAETQAVARDILRCLAGEPGAWYRTDVKGTAPGSCYQCLVKELCKAQAQQGELTAETIAMFAKPRVYEQITLPDGTDARVQAPRVYEREKVSA